ncbi:MAG: glycosyltransferase [Phycisphaerales bacterium]|jgi:glycosyltransferase involved in cell wall biosynthesis|nr:glycosyltransferase [Phycisphaerales bacterium]
MRILHISTRLILGGSQENTILSCEGQARLGHEVHLAFGPIYGPEGSLRARVEAFNTRCGAGEERVRPVGGHGPVREAGSVCAPIVMHEVKDLVREVSPLKDWRCTGALRRLIEEIGADVVHTHSSKAGILGRSAAWSARAKSRNEPGRSSGRPGVVHTIHGPPFMPIDGGLVARAKTWALNRAYTLAERRAAKRCDMIVSVADAMTREFLGRGIGREPQYVTVRSGMETGPFLHAARGAGREEVRASLGVAHDPGAAFVVGTVARLAQHKGHDDVLDALGEELLARRGLVLLWVGDGWWRERLVARARGMGLIVREMDQGDSSAQSSTREASAGSSPRLAESRENVSARDSDPPQVIVTGLVPPERIPGLMRAMDVLVHPSYREGLPRTVPQALLAGTPVVASDVDGTREACIDPTISGEDGATGLLFPVGDATRLREAVVWMHEHPLERAAMAEHGRRMCAREYDAELMVARLEAVYARATAGGVR